MTMEASVGSVPLPVILLTLEIEMILLFLMFWWLQM